MGFGGMKFWSGAQALRMAAMALLLGVLAAPYAVAADGLVVEPHNWQLGFQEAAQKADPVILEPVMEVEVLTPEEFLGDVIGDLNQRRGRILGIEAAGRAQRVRALVPQSELYKYATSLRSLTQGRAAHSRKFHAYEELPHAEIPKVVETARREREAELAAR